MRQRSCETNPTRPTVPTVTAAQRAVTSCETDPTVLELTAAAALLLLISLSIVSCAPVIAPTKERPVEPTQPPAAVFTSDLFATHWNDGRAEVNGYDLVVPRYGAFRRGVAVAVFVPEPFGNAARVKAEQANHPLQDIFQVMKFNLIEDFPTGVYDYNVMTSVFVAMPGVNGLPTGSPTKISFSAQEWVGQTYEQLLFDKPGIRRSRHGYTDGEGDVRELLNYPAGGISEDALLLWARGMAQPFLAPGQSVTLPLLRSMKVVRMAHAPITWNNAEFSRGARIEKVRVPAAEFDVEQYRVATLDGRRTWHIFVEAAFPNRVVKWDVSDGTRAELIGSERMAYWKMNGPGYEDALSKIGLSRRPPRTP